MKVFKLYNNSIKKKFNAELTGSQIFWSFRYNLEIVYFNGLIDFNKFRNAFQKTLEEFPFLFCTISKNQGKVYYVSNTKSYVELEYELKPNLTIQTINNILDLLPTNIDPKIFRNSSDINGLVVCGFKFTKLKDGFALGLFINHALVDQSSLVYILKYLSYMYNNDQTSNLASPNIIDIESVFNINDKLFKTKSEIENWAQNIGIEEKTVNSTSFSNKNLYEEKFTVELEFNIDKIKEIKKIANFSLSTNDIISAVSMKLHASDPALHGQDNFIFTFPANMRKFFNLEDNAIGSLVSMNYLYPINIKYVRDSSLIELAKLNRAKVNTIDLKHYKKELLWFKAVKEMNINLDKYSFIRSSSTINAGLLMQTNWLNFDYESIFFDNSKILKIETKSVNPNIKAGKINLIVISFNSNLIFKTPFISVSLNDKSLRQVEILAADLEIFTLKRK